VQPSTTAGLSQASQDATAGSQQDDFWQGYAGGGNTGLTQLSTGMGQIVGGLAKLHDGLTTAVSGANQLDTGTAAAAQGSHKLTGGLGQISGGLDKLADETAGLPAAAAGVTQLIAGVTAIRAGVGDDATAHTLVNGVTLASGGVSQLYDAIKASSACGARLIGYILDGTGAGVAPDTCVPNPGLPPGIPSLATTETLAGATAGPIVGFYGAVLTPMKAQFDAVAAGTDPALSAGIAQLLGGLQLIHDGLSHPVHAAGPTDQGGVAQGLDAVKAGLVKLQAGLGAATTGVSALAAGAHQANTGSQQLTSGLDKLSAGQHQVAAGLPSAVSGVGQLLDGATKAKGGIDAVQSGAVGPLTSQLSGASLNAKKQIAILAATGSLAGEAPGGAGSSYVLTQSPTGFRLAASTTSAKSSDDTARNIGVGLGGLAALVVAVGAGFAIGRRSSAAAA
jgi:putative membrane protein